MQLCLLDGHLLNGCLKFYYLPNETSSQSGFGFLLSSRLLRCGIKWAATRILGVGFHFAFTVAIKISSCARYARWSVLCVRDEEPTIDIECMELCDKIIKFVRWISCARTEARTPDFLFGRTTEEWANRRSSTSLWNYEYPAFIAGQFTFVRRRRRVKEQLNQQKSPQKKSQASPLSFCFGVFLRSLLLY